jgi:hypothetical protein
MGDDRIHNRGTQAAEGEPKTRPHARRSALGSRGVGFGWPLSTWRAAVPRSRGSEMDSPLSHAVNTAHSVRALSRFHPNWSKLNPNVARVHRPRKPLAERLELH